MTSPRYKVTYTTHEEKRDEETRPRKGSFVEFELERQDDHCILAASTYTHVFCKLQENLTIRGRCGPVHQFSRFSKEEKEEIYLAPASDRLSTVRDIAVKKIDPQASDIQGKIKIYFLIHMGLNIERNATIYRKIHGFGECTQDKDGNTYQFCEFFQGKTLQNLLLENPRLTKVQYVNLILAIIEALQEFHALGYVHGDLHGSNIIIILDQKDSRWIIKIIDPDYTRQPNQRLSLTWKILGAYNRWWHAPEIQKIKNCTKANYSQDIFSLGKLIASISGSIKNSLYQDFTAYLRLLGTQIARDDAEKRPDLETIKNQLKKYSEDSLKDEKSVGNSALKTSKKLLWLFLTEQVRLLTLQEKKGSKGAKEKKKKFL